MLVLRVSLVSAAAAAAAATLGVLLRRTAASLFEGLDSVVSFSSRVIAASRAAESALVDAYIRDPLAIVLAGRKAMARMQDALASSTDGQATDATTGVQARRPIRRIIMRTLFFDDAVLTALGNAPPTIFTGLRDALHGSVSQVVMLGSGMDSRPWRLRLPPHVAWFEVDRDDVLRMKQRTLQRAGAAFDAAKSAAKYPLASATWTGVALDLQEVGWTSKLCAAGFKPDLPTVWVLEGLLYYLEPECVPVMLKEAAQTSAPGSALVASIVDAAFVEQLKKRDVYRNKESLMSGWKWGCPGAPDVFFGQSGWRLLSCPSWLEAADVYGFPTALEARRVEARPSEDGEPAKKPSSSVRFVTAVRL